MTAVAAFLTGFFPPLSIAAANGAVLLLLVAALAAHAAAREKLTPAWTGFEPAILLFMGAWALSALCGLAPEKSLPRVLSQARFIPFYLLAWAGAGRHRDKAFQGYLWGGGLAVLWGLLQAVMDGCHANGYFSSFFAAIGEKGLYYLGFKADRAHGAVHPLTYAELILPCFFFSATYFLEAPDNKRLARRALWLGAAGGALLLSQSRGPWLAAGAGLLALLALHPRRLRLVAPIAMAAGILLLSPRFYTRVAAAGGVVPDESRAHRLILWNNAWEVGKRHWLTGVGTGNLAKAVEAHRAEPGFAQNPWGRDGDAHNQYLHHFAERGLLGLLALLAVMVTPCILAWRRLRRPEDAGRPSWISWGLAAYFLTFPVMNLTERVFDDGEPVMVFWVLAALLAKTAAEKFSAPSDKR